MLMTRPKLGAYTHFMGMFPEVNAMQSKRMVYIDTVCAVLMVFVVLQHAVRAYGSQVWWFVDDAKAPLLEHITAVNSSFFMSLFFFISFFFMPLSYD